jgi:hypothetical protein
MIRLHQYFALEDVSEILKIKPSKRNEVDFVAWFPEKSGTFSVKSAYRLALTMSMQSQPYGATSVNLNGERPSWKVVWNCPVLPKVKLMSWKICCNALSTQRNLFRRNMATTGLCQICGMEEEDTFHLFMRCPHARGLWQAMAEIWDLPRWECIQNTGKEWLLLWLKGLPVNQRANLLMLLWRIWYAHNEMTHGKPCPSIEGSCRFLVSYMNSLMLIKQ